LLFQVSILASAMLWSEVTPGSTEINAAGCGCWCRNVVEWAHCRASSDARAG